MQLLCLGDIAITQSPLPGEYWPMPVEKNPGDSYRIIFNWEFPIGTEINPVPRVRGPRLLSSPKSPDLIKNWSPGFATMATNHVLDAGVTGLKTTLVELKKRNILTVGAGMEPGEIEKPLIWEAKEGRLGVINWVFPETHPDWMKVPGPNCWPGLERAQESIAALKKDTDWVMLILHWSDELFPNPRPEDRALARHLAGFGADLIVGHHPHVVRGMEMIGNCPVFYSLGNFYFSDFSQENHRNKVQSAPRNREGLGIEFTFRRGEQPDYRAYSFWYTGDRSQPDPSDRAVRRMNQATKPLQKYQGESYKTWYASKRSAFDHWGSRWHFGVLRRGLIGTIRHQLKKIF